MLPPVGNGGRLQLLDAIYAHLEARPPQCPAEERVQDLLRAAEGQGWVQLARVRGQARRRPWDYITA